MNGVATYTGVRYTISDLDLAFLADTGTGTIRDDIFDQQWLPKLWGGAGNDVFRANYSATATAIIFNGAQATVQTPSTLLHEVERFEIVFGQVADTITGGAYDDRLTGAGGADVLTGGLGADRFIVRNAADIAGAGDRITDFFGDPDLISGSPYSGVNDLLDFSALATATFIGTNPFSLAAGQLRYAFVGPDTQVQLDANGDGAIDGLVTLSGFHFTLAETAPGSRLLIAMSMSAPDDYAATTATTGVVSPGAPANGAIENHGDRDWFKVTLTAGRTYQFDLTTAGSGIDPLLKLLSSGGVLIDTYHDGGAGSNSRGQYTPSASGIYYLEASSEAAVIGIPGAGSTGTYTLSITDLSGDAAAPQLLGSAPTDNALGVSATANIVLTFNEAVKAGAGAIEIRRSSDGGLFESISVTNASRVGFSGSTVTINPNGTFTAGAGYYVTVAAGAILDLTGNAFGGISGFGTLNFTVQAGDAAPTLIGSTPADNATGVAATSDIVLTFSEAVQAGTGAIEIRRSSDGALVESIAVSDASRVSFSGSAVTLNPQATLVAGTGYYLAIASGVIRDLAGNAFAGLAGPTALNFTVQPPTTAWTLDVPGGMALYGSGSADVITAAAGANFIGGSAGGDTLSGGTGQEYIYGEGGADTVSGGGDSDTIYGGAGDDVLRGAEGSDYLSGGPGDDILDGDGDFDLAGYEQATGGVIVSLAILGPQAVGGGEGTDTLTEIEGLIGGAFNDVLTGNAASNFLEGRGGDDVINGGEGFDTAYYRFATEGVRVDLRIAGPQLVSASQGSDTLVGIEGLTGSHFNDVLRGNADNNTLQGRLGNDTFSGGGGFDRISGGQGEDTVEFTGAASAYTQTVNEQGELLVSDTRPGSPDGVVALTGIELLKFTDSTVRVAPTLAYGLELGAAPNGVGEADEGLSAWVGQIVRTGDLSEAANYNWLLRPAGASPALASDFMGQWLPASWFGFQAGQSTVTLVIPILGNVVVDGDRTFELVITTPDGPLVKLITLYDNDSPTPQTPTGGGGGDQLFGGQAGDTLQGLGGNDQLNGGGGTDKALYTASAKDYAWWQAQDGSWRVQDLRTNSPEGTDTLLSIEQLVFADQTIKLAGATNAESLAMAFEQVLRIAAPSGTDAAFLNGLIAAVNGGQKTLAQAYGDIVQRADGSTAVAAMAYQFFAGFAPSKGGFDYLVNPDGPNPNNLNSAYYQLFNPENRYINFAVNLGKLGEGAAAFQADYGSLTLREATAKAYQEIFGGTAPNEAFLNQLLDSDVGGMTRKDYFAAYGGDGLQGLGTKAAMVGWLLTEAAKADVGVYAKSSNAYLADLADGAQFLVDMVGVYSQPDWAHNAPG